MVPPTRSQGTQGQGGATPRGNQGGNPGGNQGGQQGGVDQNAMIQALQAQVATLQASLTQLTNQMQQQGGVQQGQLPAARYAKTPAKHNTGYLDLTRKQTTTHTRQPLPPCMQTLLTGTIWIQPTPRSSSTRYMTEVKPLTFHAWRSLLTRMI